MVDSTENTANAMHQILELPSEDLKNRVRRVGVTLNISTSPHLSQRFQLGLGRGTFLNEIRDAASRTSQDFSLENILCALIVNGLFDNYVKHEQPDGSLSTAAQIIEQQVVEDTSRYFEETRCMKLARKFLKSTDEYWRKRCSLASANSRFFFGLNAKELAVALLDELVHELSMLEPSELSSQDLPDEPRLVKQLRFRLLEKFPNTDLHSRWWNCLYKEGEKLRESSVGLLGHLCQIDRVKLRDLETKPMANIKASTSTTPAVQSSLLPILNNIPKPFSNNQWWENNGLGSYGYGMNNWNSGRFSGPQGNWNRYQMINNSWNNNLNSNAPVAWSGLLGSGNSNNTTENGSSSSAAAPSADSNSLSFFSGGNGKGGGSSRSINPAKYTPFCLGSITGGCELGVGHGGKSCKQGRHWLNNLGELNQICKTVPSMANLSGMEKMQLMNVLGKNSVFGEGVFQQTGSGPYGYGFGSFGKGGKKGKGKKGW